MADILKENFDLLRQLFSDVLIAKNSTKDVKNELEEKLKVGSLLFVLIKKVNRMVKYKLRSGRDELQTQKTVVDCSRLQLQNLLYEVNYLKREIRHCYNFKSQDEDIDMHEPEPEPVDDADLNHKLRVTRLEKELQLRKQLSEDYAKILNVKSKVFNEIISKTEILSTFSPSLKVLLKATQPLQETLQLPIETNWKLEQKVHLLPQCLYLVYTNLRIIEMDDNSCKVIINGNEEQLNKTTATNLNSNSLEAYPLSLQIKIQPPEFPNDSIYVNLYYFQLIDAVTGYCDLNFSKSNLVTNENNFLQDFLKYICEDDLGDDLPGSQIELKLQNQNLNEEDFYGYLTKNKYGKPYRWLQLLCGYSLLTYDRSNNYEIHKLKEFTEDILKRIKCYWISRLRLLTQIKAFMNKNLEAYIDNTMFSKPNCTLVQLSAVIWEEIESVQTFATYINEKLIDNTCNFFRAVIVLGSAKMQCLISISSKHPLNTPFWIITVYWNGHHNAMNNSSIKAMEDWTNSLYETTSVKDILGVQLLRTMYSFDIYLETESPLYQPLEYSKEKGFIKSFSKRSRCRPYKKINHGVISYFKQ